MNAELERASRVGDREGDSFISPDVQEQAIREWAKRAERQCAGNGP